MSICFLGISSASGRQDAERDACKRVSRGEKIFILLTSLDNDDKEFLFSPLHKIQSLVKRYTKPEWQSVISCA
jgi:hypothetical protein